LSIVVFASLPVLSGRAGGRRTRPCGDLVQIDTRREVLGADRPVHLHAGEHLTFTSTRLQI
jgi:hypothetical protein